MNRERYVLKLMLDLMIMSGVDDGQQLHYRTDNSDGQWEAEANRWLISIGRREDSDLCLRNDSFVSRLHAYLRWEQERWWLQDLKSTNGTFVEAGDEDARVTGTIPIEPGEMFRVGHTWMRIQNESTLT